jgi:hypothetical protein
METGELTVLKPEIARHFLDELRGARAAVLRDSEGFDSVILVLERMGRYLVKDGHGLGDYKNDLAELAAPSPLANELPEQWPGYHLTFRTLFNLIMEARNAAIHEGSLARHLTSHSLELALILEDALMPPGTETAEHFMVRTPVQAYLWQPVSFIRQKLLENSFSFLPVWVATDAESGGNWMFVSDVALAGYLRSAPSKTQRSKLQGQRLEELVADTSIDLCEAQCYEPQTPIGRIVDEYQGRPALVLGERPKELLGILTPFDLL